MARVHLEGSAKQIGPASRMKTFSKPSYEQSMNMYFGAEMPFMNAYIQNEKERFHLTKGMFTRRNLGDYVSHAAILRAAQ